MTFKVPSNSMVLWYNNPLIHSTLLSTYNLQGTRSSWNLETLCAKCSTLFSTTFHTKGLILKLVLVRGFWYPSSYWNTKIKPLFILLKKCIFSLLIGHNLFLLLKTLLFLPFLDTQTLMRKLSCYGRLVGFFSFCQ